MSISPRRSAHLFTSVALAVLAAGALGGCSSGGLTGVTASSGGALSATNFRITSGEPRTEDDWRKEAVIAGERYRANGKDAGVALRYAEALRRTGQRTQAAAVLQQASIHNPHDQRVLGAYGRALADTGNLPQALETLERAHSPDQPDWRILSAQGAVLDQMGQHEEARRHYATALKIMPDEPSVLSNLGLSYALSRELPDAERVLRKANARGSNDKRVRQNLALVVGLQGRFNEAEEIARAELPPDEAAENIAYLKQMLAQHGRGSQPPRSSRIVARSEKL